MKTALAFHSIEPLESRIAPALLVNGANLLGGSGNPNTGETSIGENSVTLVKVLSGQALIWVDHGNITSISFGPNTTLDIVGDVSGDIVGNLLSTGRLSDSDNDPTNGDDGAALLPNNLLGLKTSPLSSEKGSVNNIITGGSIAGLSISGELSGAYAGDGVFRAESDLLSSGSVLSSVGSLDINPVQSGAQTSFVFTKAASTFQPSASIKNAQITRAAALQMFAGSGNPSGATITTATSPAGGAIVNISIDSAYVPSGSPIDTPSYALIAGDGASGKSGGAGGSIDRIIEKTSFGPVIITAGNGGNGSAAAGGAGGSITNMDLQSDSSRYVVTTGTGGNGAPAGDGGRAMNNNFSNRTPVSGVILSADFTGDDRDDILVIDAGTGQMVLSTQDDSNRYNPANDSGSTFKQVVQYVNSSSENVVLINPAGSSPVDAKAADVDGDGKLDIIVAYKNSSTLGIFFNQGKGTFYDATNDEYLVRVFGLGLAPSKIALSDANANVIAIAGNKEGKGYVQYAVPQRAGTIEDLELTVSQNSAEFGVPVADIGYSTGVFLAAFTNGTISSLQPAGVDAKKPFVVNDLGVTITGGVSDIELDANGSRLLALSPVSHTTSVFEFSGSALMLLDTISLPATGKQLVAHFTHDADSNTPDGIAVLTSLSAGSRIDFYADGTPPGTPGTADYSSASTFNTAASLKNFVPSYATDNLAGEAALAGSLSQFSFTDTTNVTAQYPLPFASKRVEIHAGDGGTGLDFAKLIGKGGTGGTVNGINADANEIVIEAGRGGNSTTGPAGTGGSVVNPANFLTATGLTVSPTLLADVVLQVEAGDGGVPTGAVAKTASGGNGGGLSGLTITLDSGDITLGTGVGGPGNGGNGGNGGGFAAMQTTARDGSLTITTGKGGDAAGPTGIGGNGGSISGFRHELTLDEDTEAKEKPYSVTITTGAGGLSAGAAAGAGGSIANVSLKLDGSNRTYDAPSNKPPLFDAHVDNTVRVVVTTGQGGDGTIGGNGGALTGFSAESVFDQKLQGGILLNFVTMSLTTGAGGAGSAGNGGNGGAMTFSRAISGITNYDPDSTSAGDDAFTATAGNGGAGSAKGGNGGSIDGLTLQNAAFFDGAAIKTTQLEGAFVRAGRGGAGGTGDGGNGGTVNRTAIGIEGGSLFVIAGNGGNGGANGKGGNGGAITNGTFGLVSTFTTLGMALQAGDGGNGTLAGGTGGVVNNLHVSTPQSTNGISAIVSAGDGGDANSAKGLGGKGGDVSNLFQVKDVNSSINAVTAGSGGDNPLGTGGAGGNITTVRTVGFIGRPSDGTSRLGVFDEIVTGPSTTVEIAQGLFSGSGGTGTKNGANGSVSAVIARQIAAISAYNGSTGAFSAATKVMNVKADRIAFDLDADGVFDSTISGTTSPSAGRPIDGFILATALSQVTGLPASPSFVFNS